MRTFAKVAVTLLLGAFAATANAHIEFVQARLFSLEGSDDRWVLEMEIHEWGSGRKLARPMRATVQFKREPQCIVNKELYLGTAPEFERGLRVIREQIAAGGLHKFGLNAMPVDSKGSRFLGVNLRVGDVTGGGPLAWIIKPEAGLDLCPFKYDFDR